jgi:DNA-binding MarR family transcriptional regulator
MRRGKSASKGDLADRAHTSVSRLAREFTKLMRDQTACGPVTVQQCYALQALTGGSRSMGDLAAEVALHQSTLTRVIEKLEKLGLVRRNRNETDQRSVGVEITAAGRDAYAVIDRDSKRTVAALLGLIAEERREGVVDALDTLAGLLDPDNGEVRALLAACSRGAGDNPEESQ